MNSTEPARLCGCSRAWRREVDDLGGLGERAGDEVPDLQLFRLCELGLPGGPGSTRNWRGGAIRRRGITVWLPPEQGAVVLQALRAWTSDLEDLADAIVGVCGDYLAGRAATAANPDTYQVIIHAGTGAITGAEPADSRASFPRKRRCECRSTHPAYPLRCHLEDGLALHPATAQMIACDATVTTMLHDANGNLLRRHRQWQASDGALRSICKDFLSRFKAGAARPMCQVDCPAPLDARQSGFR